MGNTTSGLVPIDDAGEYDEEQKDDSGYELSEADDEAEDDDDDDGRQEIGTSVGATIEPQGVSDVGPSVVASDSGYIPAFDPAWDSVDEYAGAWGLEPDSEEEDYDSSDDGSDVDSDSEIDEDEHEEEEEEEKEEDVHTNTGGAQTTPAPVSIPAAVASYTPGPPSIPPTIPLLRDDGSPHTIGHLVLELISSPSFAFASDWPPNPDSTLGSTLGSASTTATGGYYTGANSGLTLIPDDMSGYVDMDNEFNSFEGRVFGYMFEWLGPAAAMVASAPTRRWLEAGGFSLPDIVPDATPAVPVPMPVPAPASVPTTVPVSVPISAPVAACTPPPTPTDIQVQVQVQKTEPCWKWKRPLNILRQTASTRRQWRMQVSRQRWWTRVVTREARWCWTRTFMKATPACTAQTGCRIQCSRSRRGGVAGICNAGGLGRCFNAGCPGEGVGQESSHCRPSTTLTRSSSHQIPLVVGDGGPLVDIDTDSSFARPPWSNSPLPTSLLPTSQHPSSNPPSYIPVSLIRLDLFS